MSKVAEGEWGDDVQDELESAIFEAIDDFGPDFDEEGNELEEGESDRVKDEEERKKGSHAESDDDDDSDDDDSDSDDEESEESEDKEGAAA